MYDNSFPNRRYGVTLEFLKKVLPKAEEEHLLDLGVTNPFVAFMEKEGYTITNTTGEDLDIDTTALSSEAYTAVTAFEIFEHLLSPFTILKAIEAKKLIASVPLKLWFASAYQSKTDPWDRHYHEFEDWQFDWLLEKTGWKIKDSIKFTNPINKIGIRPLLRKFTPRYYLIYAERS